MTNEEAIKTIKCAIAEVEWEYPIEYAEAFDKAIEALKKKSRFSKNDFYYSTDEKKLYRFDGEEWRYD